MAKSRNFSIYLLKNGYSHENSLKEDHGLTTIQSSSIPSNGVMYITNKRANNIWWCDYWGIPDKVQVNQGAIVFLPIKDNRIIALTFGATYHKLKQNCHEYDFGLRTTLNSLDPKKIKSTDILLPESAKRQRIQTPTASSLNYFDIKQNESIIKKLTGAVKEEYIELFKNATGASSLSISSKKESSEFIDLCNTIYDIYKLETYKETFPDIQNIVPVKDPDKIKCLNAELIKAFSEAPFELVLTIPDIVDFHDGIRIKYSGAGLNCSEYEDVRIGEYRACLSQDNVTINDVSYFEKHSLSIIDENGNTIKSYRIFDCFLYDCTILNENFHLCDGEWYQIDTNYIEKLSSQINPYFLLIHDLLKPRSSNESEGDYNSRIADENDGVICLDKRNISPDQQTAVEPCDIVYINSENHIEFIHVKISTRSASLSHLFNQGINSIELLRTEEQSRNKLKELLPDKFHELVDNGNFEVTYGIITKKADSNADNYALNLPIFSRISLARTINALRIMGVKCRLFYIKDNSHNNCNQDNNS